MRTMLGNRYQFSRKRQGKLRIAGGLAGMARQALSQPLEDGSNPLLLPFCVLDATETRLSRPDNPALDDDGAGAALD